MIKNASLLILLIMFCENYNTDIDIIKGNFYNIPINELTIDRVTDILGRPSLIIDEPDSIWNYISGKMTYNGSEILYQNKGLCFRFNHKNDDPFEKCRSIDVYLNDYIYEKGLFDDSLVSFSQFSGSISRKISNNWKADDVLKNFSDFKLINQFDPKRIKEIKTIFKKDPVLKDYIISICYIEMKTAHYKIYFYYNEITKFIEYFTIMKK